MAMSTCRLYFKNQGIYIQRFAAFTTLILSVGITYGTLAARLCLPAPNCSDLHLCFCYLPSVLAVCAFISKCPTLPSIFRISSRNYVNQVMFWSILGWSHWTGICLLAWRTLKRLQRGKNGFSSLGSQAAYALWLSTSHSGCHIWPMSQEGRFFFFALQMLLYAAPSHRKYTTN